MNSWCLITGASAGIGWATAQKLAERKYNFLLVGRREDRLKALSAQLSQKGVKVIVDTLDIQNEQQIAAFADRRLEQLQNLDLLINNAGLAKGTEKLQDAKISDWQTMMETNVMGLLYLTRQVLPHMIKRKQGHIVNMGSVAGRWTYPGGAVYCASKFAVRAISEGLRMDLMGTPIRVTNIEPGMVNTEFSMVRFEDKEKADAVYQNMKPLTAEDIAETIDWVISRPAHVNIQELVIFPTDQAAVGQVHRHK